MLIIIEVDPQQLEGVSDSKNNLDQEIVDKFDKNSAQEGLDNQEELSQADSDLSLYLDTTQDGSNGGQDVSNETVDSEERNTSGEKSKLEQTVIEEKEEPSEMVVNGALAKSYLQGNNDQRKAIVAGLQSSELKEFMTLILAHEEVDNYLDSNTKMQMEEFKKNRFSADNTIIAAELLGDLQEKLGNWYRTRMAGQATTSQNADANSVIDANIQQVLVTADVAANTLAQSLEQQLSFRAPHTEHVREIKNLDKFYGKPNDDIEGWLFDVEICMKQCRLNNDEDRFIAIGAFLKEVAKTEYVEYYRSNRPARWSEFREILRKRFSSKHKDMVTREKLAKLSTRTAGSIEAYVEKFNLLSSQIFGMNEMDKVLYFRSGLSEKPRAYVRDRGGTTISDAMNAAQDYIINYGEDPVNLKTS